MKIPFSVAIALVYLVCGVAAASAQFAVPPGGAPAFAAPPVFGQVISAQRGPLAGVTISLVHPVIGRSQPVFSAQNGTFALSGIPPRQEPYFIEAYWGVQLLYRGTLSYQGASVRYNIQLP